MTDVDILKLIQTYAAHSGLSVVTVSKKIGSHNRLALRLSRGLGCSSTTIRNTSAWFHENWPADLEWPAGIPRPQIKKVSNSDAA